MVSLEEVEWQLKQIGANFRFWGRSEVVELQHILIPGEQIQVCINGRYEGGFALLCATDQRLLLVDKKPMYLTLEDVRYDMVSEVDFSHRMVDATIHVCTPTKTLRFTALRKTDLRKMTGYLQHRVLEIRQHAMQQHAQQVQPLPQFQQQFQQAQQQHALPGQVPAIAPQANVAATNANAPLPIPAFSNPYANTTPLLMRRRISRFQKR